MSLEALGIRSGEDVQHRQRAQLADYPPACHLPLAEDLLRRAAPIIVSEVVPNLTNYPVRWNPGSFMVFPLGMHDHLGSLRLHVWTAGLRETSHGPNIHEHGWHLSSLVLAGPYTDNLYQLEQVQKPPGEEGLLRLYMTERGQGGHDALTTDGALVGPRIIAERSIPQGQIHHIEAGVYHFTTVPLDRLVVTLVVDSPAFVEATGVLLDRGSPTKINRRRISVERSHVLLTREQILRHHSLK